MISNRLSWVFCAVESNNNFAHVETDFRGFFVSSCANLDGSLCLEARGVLIFVFHVVVFRSFSKPSNCVFWVSR